MNNFMMYVTMFVFVYLVYLLFVLIRPKQLEKFKKSSYVTLLVNMYHLDLKKINFNVMAHMICLANAFVLATVVFSMSWVKNTILMILLGFVVMLGMTFLLYHLIGTLYRKKGK